MYGIQCCFNCSTATYRHTSSRPRMQNDGTFLAFFSTHTCVFVCIKRIRVWRTNKKVHESALRRCCMMYFSNALVDRAEWRAHAHTHTGIEWQWAGQRAANTINFDSAFNKAQKLFLFSFRSSSRIRSVAPNRWCLNLNVCLRQHFTLRRNTRERNIYIFFSFSFSSLFFCGGGGVVGRCGALKLYVFNEWIMTRIAKSATDYRSLSINGKVNRSEPAQTAIPRTPHRHEWGSTQ